MEETYKHSGWDDYWLIDQIDLTQFNQIWTINIVESLTNISCVEQDQIVV